MAGWKKTISTPFSPWQLRTFSPIFSGKHDKFFAPFGKPGNVVWVVFPHTHTHFSFPPFSETTFVTLVVWPEKRNFLFPLFFFTLNQDSSPPGSKHGKRENKKNPRLRLDRHLWFPRKKKPQQDFVSKFHPRMAAAVASSSLAYNCLAITKAKTI